jgi:hypothetical protein
MALLSTTLSYDDIGSADLVIEAVFEEIGVKEAVFKELDRVMKPGAILASNTSTLDVNKIAHFTKRPQDVVGMHFFSPANVMKLLEVVRGDATAKDVLATVMAVSKKIKKTAEVSGVCDGFIGNRMIEQYGRQGGFLGGRNLRHYRFSRRAGRVQGAQADGGHFRIDRFHIAGARQGRRGQDQRGKAQGFQDAWHGSMASGSAGWGQAKCGGWVAIIRGAPPSFGDFGPSSDAAAITMLHGGQPDGFIRAVRRAEHDDEFIIMLIGQRAAFPDDLGDRVGDHAAMAIGNRGRQWLAGDGNAPAGFGHGPCGGGAFGQGHGDAHGGLLPAAMRHAKSSA